MLTKRKLRPRLVRLMHRKLESPDTPDDQKLVIAQALDKPDVLEKFNTFFHGEFKKEKIDVPAGEFGAADDLTFWERLVAYFEANWMKWLAFLIQILAL